MKEHKQIVNAGDFSSNVEALLNILDARSKDIIIRRFGLETGEVETLDSIGKEYGITRERVRQIEYQAKKILARRFDVLEKVGKYLEDLFKQYGGLLDEDHLIEIINNYMDKAPRRAQVLFYLYILPPYEYIVRADKLGAHWSHKQIHSQYADPVIGAAANILSKGGKPLEASKLSAAIRESLGVTSDQLPDRCINAILVASKELKKTVFNQWGLIGWVDTSPRGVGDKAYIVLRRHGKPTHFRDITEMINEVGFDYKRAHEQTVHNELIKDERFVLVGRGLYGLTDWGFIPGTVADVLLEVMGTANKPLTKEELLERVLDQRMVKKTTILLGLQNNEKFQKLSDGRYKLKST